MISLPLMKQTVKSNGILWLIFTAVLGVLLAQFLDVDRPRPDEYDLENTRAYAQTLKRLEVPLLDHLLVGAEEAYSMRDCGDVELEPFSSEAANMGERYMGAVPSSRSRLREEDVDWFADDR